LTDHHLALSGTAV